MQDRFFYSLSFSFLLGVFLRSFFFIDIYLIFVFFTISVFVFLYFYFLSKNDLVKLFSICIFIFCLGVLDFHIADKNPPTFFESKVGQNISLNGKIIDEPSVGENNQKLIIETENQKIKTNILISTNLNDGYNYGDQVYVNGFLKKPENFITDTGKEFDYVNYLKKDGILYKMDFPKIEVVDTGSGNNIKNILFKIKNKFLEKINVSLKTPENLFLGGLILGEKASFSSDLRKSFIDTGTIHIVALSGYNITIVAEWVMTLFYFLPNIFAISLGILTIVLFIIMTGAGSTAIRAGVMASLVLLSRLLGRNYDVGRSLVVALLFMVLFNPFILVFDISFQLSFLATIAVIYLSPRLEKYFLWVTKRFNLRDIFSITFAAYIFVAPFILYNMGNFSLVALPVNFLILPFIPLTMLSGFILGFVGLIYYPLSMPFSFVAHYFLYYELWVIRVFSSFGYASLYVNHFPLLITLLIYAYFIYFLFLQSSRKKVA